MHKRVQESVALPLESDGTSRLARGWLAVLAGAIAIALAFASLIGAGPAMAATPGITTNVTINGEKYNDTPVVKEGDIVTMKIQYGVDVVSGSTVRIALGPNVTLKDLPKGNTAITEIKVDPADANAVLITFANPLPSDVNQGVLDLAFTVNEVEKSSGEKISWSVDDEEQSLDVIIKNGGDEFANVTDSVNKSVAGSTPGLNSFVSVNDGIVTLAEGILNAEIPYTLKINRAAAQGGFTISDELPAGMTYVASSFTGSQTTWDENGLNKTTNTALTFAPVITGNTFAGELDLPGPSLTTLKYSAVVADAPSRAALEAQLQIAYDKVKDSGGSYNVPLRNLANLGGLVKAASTSVGGNVAGPVKPDVGKAFKKASAWVAGTAIEPAEDGTLIPAKDVTFTFTSDLNKWSGVNEFTTLRSNVVISDALPSQLSWKSADTGFIASAQLSLTKADPLPNSLDAFSEDSYVDTYYIDETTQTLYINIGKDSTRIVEVKALAQLNTVEGLTVKNSTIVPGQNDYSVRNRAEWNYTDTEKRTTGYNSDSTVHSQTENIDGFNHPDYFKKAAVTPTVEIAPGMSADVAYNFTVGQNKGIDLTKSWIVDYVDTNIFDVSDQSKIKVSGEYDGSRPMDASSFDVELNDGGNLTLTLSDAGIAQVTGWGLDKKFVLKLTLPTKKVDGKQTLKIKNKATLFGQDDNALYWSEASSEATTYGDEAEVSKSVRDTPNQEWTQNLRAKVDAEGKLVQKNFVYNIALVPHGSFDNVTILDVVDNLPDGLKFEGFVSDSNVDSGANPSLDVQDLKANVQARFEPSPDSEQGGTVVLFQKPGTRLNASEGIPSANILVSIVDYSIDEAIVNTIGNTSATITPSDGYPLAIAKVDSEDANKVINDPNAHFQILNAEGDVVVDNVFVKDGALRVAGEDGTAKNIKVTEIGTYTVKEISPPAGYELSTRTITVVVGADGSSTAVKFLNTPARTYAVGDYVWIDANRDGLQDIEAGLKDVTVRLLDNAGAIVETTVTDANGWYIFDNLPAGEYQIEFELTADQKKKYDFTVANVKDDAQDANDSDADPKNGRTPKFALDGENKALTKAYELGNGFEATEGIDPTWDAGVVLKPSVSVGDFVWLDSNRDGVQSEGEKGIKDVVLTITGPDGTAVVNVFGKAVPPTKTDENGAYTFENLPVLKEGESYTVSIDRDESAKALAPYLPTIIGVGDRGTDSSTWMATSEGLTADGDRDSSLDFGFVLIPEPVTPVELKNPSVTTPAAPGPGTTAPAVPEPAITAPTVTETDVSVPATASSAQALSNTGFSGTWLLGVGLLLTMLGGGAVAATAKRRRTARVRH